MGLTVYKPPKDKKKFLFLPLWVITTILIFADAELGSSIGLWIHTGVWHW